MTNLDVYFYLLRLILILYSSDFGRMGKRLQSISSCASDRRSTRSLGGHQPSESKKISFKFLFTVDSLHQGHFFADLMSVCPFPLWLIIPGSRPVYSSTVAGVLCCLGTRFAGRATKSIGSRVANNFCVWLSSRRASRITPLIETSENFRIRNCDFMKY